MIYLDHLSTTPCAPEVIEAMRLSLEERFGNPSSAHALGWRAREEVEESRATLARLLKVRPQRVTFTSGATEASYLAFEGSVTAILSEGERRASILSQQSEHSATLGPLQALSARHGIELRLAPLSPLGQVDLEAFAARLDSSVKLVSVMHVNNELGVIQPIEALTQLVRSRAHPRCLIHVDGAQAVGKLDVDLSALDVDLYSLSAHKFYGPKGVGALVTWLRGHRANTSLPRVLFGGGQERGLRPGTVATHQAVGLGVAAGLVLERHSVDSEHTAKLASLLLRELSALGASLTVEGPRVSGALSLRCPPRLYERVIDRWAGAVAFSQSSACHSGQASPSHVLSALGLSAEEASRVIRLCVGRYTREDEVKRAISLLQET